MDFRRLFRNRTIVVRTAQYTYGITFALVTVTLSAVILVGSVWFFYVPVPVDCPDGGEGCSAIVIAPTSLSALLLTLAGLTVPATLLSFLMGVLISNRTYGPMVRIKSFVEALKAGDYSARLQMRKRDHIGELSEIFNGLAETLEKKYPPKKLER